MRIADIHDPVDVRVLFDTILLLKTQEQRLSSLSAIWLQ